MDSVHIIIKIKSESSGGAAGSWTMVTDPSLSFNFLTKPALNCPSFRKQSGVKWFAQPDINEFSESESEVTCGQIWWPILGICALHLTHSNAHTHTPWTHTRSSGQPYCCSTRGAVGGLVPCSSVSPQSWYSVKVEESAGYSLQNQNGLIIETV